MAIKVYLFYGFIIFRFLYVEWFESLAWFSGQVCLEIPTVVSEPRSFRQKETFWFLYFSIKKNLLFRKDQIRNRRFLRYGFWLVEPGFGFDG